jgi:hypothetical protein
MSALNRREFLAGMAALGAGTLLHGCAATDNAPAGAGAKPHRIDIHHHFVSPGYSAALKQRGQGHAKWSVQMSLDDMDKSGIQTSLLSLIQPALAFGDVALGRKLAREANEHAATLVRDHAGRFGSFATLPYPDAEGSLSEIAYALDTLKAEGFCLMTSYGGRYLGDSVFWPVLEELNRRRAVVYTHPLAPECCGKIPSPVSVGAIEYAVDTTRTMASLMFHGAARAIRTSNGFSRTAAALRHFWCRASSARRRRSRASGKNCRRDFAVNCRSSTMTWRRAIIRVRSMH